MKGATARVGHYHLHVHTISKLKGHNISAAVAYRRAEKIEQGENHSVVHAAAYRRAQKLGNDGQVFDYRRKMGVAWTGIMAPAHTPKELLDPLTLWRTVERLESRANARMAREIIIALPHQVDLQVHVKMLRAFVTSQLTARGMVADVAIHAPPVANGGDPRNWHAHVLLTDRPMTATGFAATKDRNWNARENVTIWRKAWADTHNATMAALGLPYRIDHRSLEAQRQEALARGDIAAALELDRTPQIHVGRDLHRSRRTDQLAPKAVRNRDILLANRVRAAAKADDLQGCIARADAAAHREARINALKQHLWRPETPPLTLAELEARYGRRPAAVTRLLQRQIDAKAQNLAATWGWHRDGPPETSLDILAFLRMESNAARQPSARPWFAMTPNDLAFAFYRMGLLSRDQLQNALEADAELRQTRRTEAKRAPPAAWLPRAASTRPKPATPRADHLAALQRLAPIQLAVAGRRLAQLNAFNVRIASQNTQRRTRTLTKLDNLIRARRKQSPSAPPPW